MRGGLLSLQIFKSADRTESEMREKKMMEILENVEEMKTSMAKPHKRTKEEEEYRRFQKTLRAL